MRLLLALCLATLALAADPVGVRIAYRLPADGPLPRTWRVTLAITDPANPDWILSQFAAGVVRTVTAENGGRFEERWDGLDDNRMPLPPGSYGVKGICMPAERWAVDGEFHTITPVYVGGVSDWLPKPADAGKDGEPFRGDPVGSPIRDVAVSPEGIAVFYYGYLENGLNNPMIDLRRTDGPGQFLRSFNSGGAGGGTATCTDGEMVWSYSQDGGHHVIRADGRDFGHSPRAMRKNSYQPDGHVSAMAALREGGATTVFIAERGRLVPGRWEGSLEEGAEPVDVVKALEGEGGKIRAVLPLPRPRGLAARAGRLYALHAMGAGFGVSALAVPAGLKEGAWSRLFALPAGLDPGGIAVDGSGRIYISDPAGNRVHQYSADGKRLRSYGRLEVQKPGTYDRETLMKPVRLASWTDGTGADRLLVVEQAGPCRVSEWSADGRLLREFPSLQTSVNDGWAVDPADARHAYILGYEGWLTRFAIDYRSGRFSVDAVWPEVGTDPLLPGLPHVRMVRVEGRPYLACPSRDGYAIHRFADGRWKLCAGIVTIRGKGPAQRFAWRDDDGDGRIAEAEYRDHPMQLPGNIMRYHGEQVGDDLALLALTQGQRDAWRLPVARFDERGIPEFGPWERILTDPVLAARAAGTATALTGANELDDTFASDWAMVAGDPRQGYWVSARGGSLSANVGAQERVSAYVPDGKGGMRLRWRVGRSSMGGTPAIGETVGAMHIQAPMNGIIPVIDQSRCGVVLYDRDGMYVDTLFPPGGCRLGLYDLPGEFFAGMLYADQSDGAIYVGVGKDTPLVFRCAGWSLKESPVRPLTVTTARIDLAAAQIGTPPEMALAVRGGAGVARVARFAPAFGGVAHDGSLDGWENCQPVRFADGARTVEVRSLWDRDALHFRIHARTGAPFAPRALQPIERVFAHDRASDAVSIYLQADPAAKPAGAAVGGRPGDLRIVTGLFADGGKVRPAAVGFHPAWSGPGAQPQSYRTPVGKAEFAHVGELPGTTLGGMVDADGAGYVVGLSIPRAAVPGLPPIGPELRTMVDFEATFGGKAKFWWANTDGSASRETLDEPSEARLYPGAWAPAEFTLPPEGSGMVVRNWQVCGPFGGPGAEAFNDDPPGPMKEAVQRFFQAASYPPDSGAFAADAIFAGEQVAGWWKPGEEVRWRPAAVREMDNRVHLGRGGAQVWYATAWIHAAAATPVTFVLHSMPMAHMRLSLDGEVIYDGKPGRGEGPERWAADAPGNLVPGWHRVQIRTFCWGYGSAKAGLEVVAPRAVLWGLRCSGKPPAR